MNTTTPALKTDLKSLTKDELTHFCSELGLQSFRADQLFQWMYQKGISDFGDMTNLSKDLRDKLREIAVVNRIQMVQQQESKDGTIKFLFQLNDEEEVYKIVP